MCSLFQAFAESRLVREVEEMSKKELCDKLLKQWQKIWREKAEADDMEEWCEEAEAEANVAVAPKPKKMPKRMIKMLYPFKKNNMLRKQMMKSTHKGSIGSLLKVKRQEVKNTL